MGKKRSGKWRQWIPHFELHLSLWPIFAIRSHLMHESFDRMTFEYIRLDIWLLKHRVFGINLWRKPHGS